MTPSRDHRKMIKIVLPAAIIQNDCLSLLTQKFSFRKTRSIATRKSVMNAHLQTFDGKVT